MSPRACHGHYPSLQVGRTRNGEDGTWSQGGDITHGYHALTKTPSGGCHTVCTWNPRCGIDTLFPGLGCLCCHGGPQRRTNAWVFTPLPKTRCMFPVVPGLAFRSIWDHPVREPKFYKQNDSQKTATNILVLAVPSLSIFWSSRMSIRAHSGDIWDQQGGWESFWCRDTTPLKNNRLSSIRCSIVCLPQADWVCQQRCGLSFGQCSW